MWARRTVSTLTTDCTIAKFDPLRGDAVFELDAKLAKNIKLGERVNLQLVAQAFNLTNRANYGNNFGDNISSATLWPPHRILCSHRHIHSALDLE